MAHVVLKYPVLWGFFPICISRHEDLQAAAFVGSFLWSAARGEPKSATQAITFSLSSKLGCKVAKAIRYLTYEVLLLSKLEIVDICSMEINLNIHSLEPKVYFREIHLRYGISNAILMSNFWVGF